MYFFYNTTSYQLTLFQADTGIDLFLQVETNDPVKLSKMKNVAICANICNKHFSVMLFEP